MKVLHVINSLDVCGAEKLITLLIPEQRAQQVDADLLVFSGERTLLHDELEQAGVTNWRTLNCKAKYSIDAIPKLRKVISEYDVVHTHLFPALWWLSLAVMTLPKSKRPALVCTEHNTDNKRRNSALLSKIDKQMYRPFDVAVAVSYEAENTLKEYLKNINTDITTIENAIDVDRFKNASPADMSEICGLSGSAAEDAKFVVQVAAFRAQKDQDTLIKSAALLPENVHIVLIGKGSRQEELETLAEQQNVEDRVHFLGHRGDIPEILKGADIAALSSHFEGLSMSVLESFASGTPFIGTDSPGLGQLAKMGGVAVDRESATHLAETISKILTDAEYASSLSEKGSNLAENYRLSKMCEHYINLYKTI